MIFLPHSHLLLRWRQHVQHAISLQQSHRDSHVVQTQHRAMCLQTLQVWRQAGTASFKS